MNTPRPIYTAAGRLTRDALERGYMERAENGGCAAVLIADGRGRLWIEAYDPSARRYRTVATYGAELQAPNPADLPNAAAA